MFFNRLRENKGGTSVEGQDKLLIIDAANFKKEPGTIDTVEGDKIPVFLSSKLSVHQIGLPDMLFAARLMGITPSEMCLIGIQPLNPWKQGQSYQKR